MEKIKALLSGQKNIDGNVSVVTIKDVDCSIAYHGLEEIDAEVDLIPVWMSLYREDFEKYNVCIGGVRDCQWALHKMGITFYLIPCYPESLKIFQDRSIEVISFHDLLKNMDYFYSHGHRFVKPVQPKRFQAFLTSNRDALDMLYNVEPDTQVYISDIVKFISEWRVYVKFNRIVRICHYSGNPLVFPNTVVIRAMIDAWTGPCCYALDVGVIGDRTSLVEVNDFYSIGNYGLFPGEYVEMLILRWAQITGKDPFPKC
jgi:hypothetical protein